MTPLARDELTGPRGAGYRRIIEDSLAGRAGTRDEVAAVGTLVIGPMTASSLAATSSWTPCDRSLLYGDLAKVRSTT
jgi:hypothetical protein